jgi:putative tryptophan/tyrosine transport system substrate-binding protein
MSATMKRREFITLLGGAAAAWPLAARAQQSAVRAIGFLHSTSRDATPSSSSGFRRGLAETGMIEGRNVAIEYRWAEGQHDRLPASPPIWLAAGVAYTTRAALAAKADAAATDVAALLPRLAGFLT